MKAFPQHCIVLHFSHPFLGTHEVIQLCKLANLKGTPFQSVITSIPFHLIPYHTTPYHSTTYHTIQPHTIPFDLIPYHTISPHTIPYHPILYHHSKAVTGCLGFFLQNMKIIPAGYKAHPLSSIFCGELDLLKISSIGFYPWFLPFTLWIAGCNAGPLGSIFCGLVLHSSSEIVSSK